MPPRGEDSSVCGMRWALTGLVDAGLLHVHMSPADEANDVQYTALHNHHNHIGISH